jgi:hypothetical protein
MLALYIPATQGYTSNIPGGEHANLNALHTSLATDYALQDIPPLIECKTAATAPKADFPTPNTEASRKQNLVPSENSKAGLLHS